MNSFTPLLRFRQEDQYHSYICSLRHGAAASSQLA